MSERSLPAVLFKVYSTVVLIIADYINISIARIPVSGISVVIAVPLPDKVVAVQVVGKGIVCVYHRRRLRLRGEVSR